MARRRAKNHHNHNGWLIPLCGGPYDGNKVRVGALVPPVRPVPVGGRKPPKPKSTERLPMDETIEFPNGVVYRLEVPDEGPEWAIYQHQE